VVGGWRTNRENDSIRGCRIECVVYRCVVKRPKIKTTRSSSSRVNCSSPDVQDWRARLVAGAHEYLHNIIYGYYYYHHHRRIRIYKRNVGWISASPRTRMICVDARAKPISTRRRRHRRLRVLIFNGRVALKTKRHRRCSWTVNYSFYGLYLSPTRARVQIRITVTYYNNSNTNYII